MVLFSNVLATATGGIDSVLNNGLSLSEKVALSLKMLLMGMGTVFAVLAIIWFFLTVFRLVMDKTKKKPKEEPAPAAPEKTDDGATVAAIVAAITAMREEEGVPAPASFRVVSFERRDGVKPWKKKN